MRGWFHGTRHETEDDRTMDALRFERLRRYFARATALPPSLRPAWIERRVLDRGLRVALVRLLQVSDAESRPAQLESDALLGASVAGWRLEEFLGRGGEAMVFLAERSGVWGSMKLVMSARERDFDAARSRLHFEALVLSRMSHQSIVSCIEAGSGVLRPASTGSVDGCDGRVSYLVTDWVEDAETIVDAARLACLSTAERIAILIDVCDGMAHAHSRGVMHLDVKPSNVLLDGEGAVRIIDFGASDVDDFSGGLDAKSALASELADVRPRGAFGSVAYLSPERIDPAWGEITYASDVYSIAVVGYELLVGHMPYALGCTRMSACEAIQHVDPIEPHRLNRRIPVGVSEVLQRALAKRSGGRFASAVQLAAALRGESV